MKKIIIAFFIFSISNCSSTIEFLPDTDFTSRNLLYAKTTYKEVEILSTKPTKPYRTQGLVVFRSFSGEESIDRYIIDIQKELFERKIDGVWFDSTLTKEEGVPILVRAENQQGIIVSFAEANTEIGKKKGIAFRYLENGKPSKNLR
jgi:hypothetical protein